MIEYVNIEEYKKTDCLYEVEDFLKYLVKNRVVFNGWQKRSNGSRKEYKLFIEEINPYEPEIRVVLTHDSPEADLATLDKDNPLYVYTDSKKYIAEVKIVYVSKQHFFIMPPVQLVVKKQKKVPRIILNEDCRDKRQIDFIKNKKAFTLSLLDVSSTGLGMLVSSSKLKYFKYENDTIHITKLFGLEFDHTIQGKIVYVQPLQDNKQFYRIGVQFFDEIELTDFQLPG